MSAVQEMLEQKLLEMNTAFLGRVTAFDGKQATIQPLTLYKAYGAPAVAHAPIVGVPVLHNARYKIHLYENDCMIHGNQGCGLRSTAVSGSGGDGYFTGRVEDGRVDCSCTTEKRQHVGVTPIAPGDIAYCICADRDITDARKGVSAAPAPGHHEITDAIVVGVLT